MNLQRQSDFVKNAGSTTGSHPNITSNESQQQRSECEHFKASFGKADGYATGALYAIPIEQLSSRFGQNTRTRHL